LGHRVIKGDTLRLIDLEGQQAVDFLPDGRGTHGCFANFVEVLPQFGLCRSYVISNVNFSMSVPVAAGGAAVDVYGRSKPRGAQ